MNSYSRLGGYHHNPMFPRFRIKEIAESLQFDSMGQGDISRAVDIFQNVFEDYGRDLIRHWENIPPLVEDLVGDFMDRFGQKASVDMLTLAVRLAYRALGEFWDGFRQTDLAPMFPNADANAEDFTSFAHHLDKKLLLNNRDWEAFLRQSASSVERDYSVFTFSASQVARAFKLFHAMIVQRSSSFRSKADFVYWLSETISTPRTLMRTITRDFRLIPK